MRVDTHIVTHAAVDHDASQDAYFVGVSSYGTVIVVADGHGASWHAELVVEYAKELVVELGRYFCALPNEPCDEMIKWICHHAQDYLAYLACDTTVGAVATVALITRDAIKTVQVGDCVIMRYLPSGPTATEWLTRPHNPDHQSEMHRLCPIYETGDFRPMRNGSLGNAVATTRIYRVGTGDSVEFSRSFGDFGFHPAVICDPEVHTFQHQEQGEIIYAVCSDGGVRTAARIFSAYRDSGALTIADQMVPERPDDDVTVVLALVTSA